MSNLALSFGLSSNPRTWPLLQGRVGIEGVDPVFTVRHPSELFWRQLKFHEFDVSEMSLSTWMRLVARGEPPFVAIPVFTTRRFFHTEVLVRADAGIASPADLKGKRVGVPEYQQTAALWARGVLEHEFGVRPADMEFWMERVPEVSHAGASGFAFPAGVTIHQIPAEKNIGSMMATGELDATLFYLTDRNLVDRSRIDLRADPAIRPLFDAVAEGTRYYRKTGIYPINHTMVIRKSLFERHPWVALNVIAAFQEANRIADAERLEQTAYYIHAGLLPPDAAAALATPLVQHGLHANAKVIETAAAYSHEQGLTPRRLTPAELFAPATLEL
jgi:4,5-dihydroxyphthalate decarboxylase